MDGQIKDNRKHKYIGMNLNELESMIDDMNAAETIENDGKYYVNVVELKEIIHKHLIDGNRDFRKMFDSIFRDMSNMYD